VTGVLYIQNRKNPGCGIAARKAILRTQEPACLIGEIRSTQNRRKAVLDRSLPDKMESGKKVERAG